MMTTRDFFFFLLIGFSSYLHGQNSVPERISSLFHAQLSVFPQEKIHLHTDKPYYISGEKIWFRAHVADAATHYPVSYSRYVYVELINPLDTVVTRVKIREEDGSYYGCLTIPADAPGGDYTIRSFTTFMRSMDEHYFCTKTVRICDPQARVIHTETQFILSSGRRERVDVAFRFSNVSASTPLVPKSVKVSVNDGKMMNIEVEDDGTARVNFNLPAASRKRTILLEAVAFNYPYRQFIQIPAPDDDFDVSFYPEGGALMQGALCMVGFKAMKSNGQATHISGVVYDQMGTEVQRFESEHLGMGRFILAAEKGKNYYAVCETGKGQSKRFHLPASVNHGYALAVSSLKNIIYVSVLKPAAELSGLPELYLLAHTRGMVHFVSVLDESRHQIVIPANLFPSGVLHFILFDAGMNPLSERLFFINNNDRAQVEHQSEQNSFARRSLVKNRITLIDSEGNPLSGSFSVSITSDSEVTPDSTSNILTQLLLASDLRGNIVNPAYYFQNARTSAYALDLLMMTQGWRRYNILELMKGNIAHPVFPVETGPEFSGTVKSDMWGRPLADVEVTAVSFTGGFTNSVQTEREGRFILPVADFPDSTLFMITVDPKKGLTQRSLLLDRETFPGRTLPAAQQSELDMSRFAKYAEKAELKYIGENGVRVYEIPEVIIKAQRLLPQSRSHFYSNPSNSVTEEELKKLGAISIYDVIRRIPGVNLEYNIRPPPLYMIFLRGSNSIPRLYSPPLIMIDNMPMGGGGGDDVDTGSIIDLISIYDIAQIDILKGPNTAIFGSRGANGVIAIYTKSGNISLGRNSAPSFNTKALLPLGYQQPVEFYAPKYDTPEKRNASTPDLRTTIHWQPVVQTDDEGVASFEFYTADEASSYSVVIEGLTADGRIVRQVEKIRVE